MINGSVYNNYSTPSYKIFEYKHKKENLKKINKNIIFKQIHFLLHLESKIKFEFILR